jgi:tetratricopeptide (TPR) repeat protein
MKQHMTWLQLVGITLVVALVIGCGAEDDVGFDPEPDPAPTPTLVELGWAAFRAGQFDTAESLFSQAITEDASNHEAHNGKGWALLRLDNLTNAIVSFDAALTNGFAGADPHVGKAILLRDLKPVNYAAAIAEANTALSIESDYTFAHDPELNWKDVRLILAQSYFATGEYNEANSQVSLLGGTVQDPASDTFVEDLLAEIQALGDSIR